MLLKGLDEFLVRGNNRSHSYAKHTWSWYRDDHLRGEANFLVYIVILNFVQAIIHVNKSLAHGQTVHALVRLPW